MPLEKHNKRLRGNPKLKGHDGWDWQETSSGIQPRAAEFHCAALLGLCEQARRIVGPRPAPLPAQILKTLASMVPRLMEN